MHAHISYDLTAVHLFKCILNLGPRAVNMLRAQPFLNPSLSLHPCTASSLQHWISCSCNFHMHWDNIQLLAQRISYPIPSGKCG